MTVWSKVRQLLAVQVTIGGLSTLGLLLTPAGLAFAAPVAALALLFGAYFWALRVGRAEDWLGRLAVRALAWRVGLVVGAGVGATYLAVGLVPGQLDLPWYGLLPISAILAAAGAATGAALTLCGLDLGRPAEGRSELEPPGEAERQPARRAAAARERGAARAPAPPPRAS